MISGIFVAKQVTCSVFLFCANFIRHCNNWVQGILSKLSELKERYLVVSSHVILSTSLHGYSLRWQYLMYLKLNKIHNLFICVGLVTQWPQNLILDKCSVEDLSYLELNDCKQYVGNYRGVTLNPRKEDQSPFSVFTLIFYMFGMYW